MRKPTFWFPPGPTQTKLYSHKRWLEAGNFGLRKKRDFTIYVAKNIGAVTAKLICVFVFAYAKCWFSHDAAQIFSVVANQNSTSIILLISVSKQQPSKEWQILNASILHILKQVRTTTHTSKMNKYTDGWLTH